MKNNKVGIITHWAIPNFGAFMQAYALRNVISNIFPSYDVVQISYMNRTHFKAYYSLEVHELFKLWLINPHFYLDVMRRLLKLKHYKEIRTFITYYNRFIPHSTNYNKHTIRKDYYDFIVLGSDILWDYSIDYFGNDSYVFGLNLNCKKKISYAASFGTVKLDAAHPDYVSRAINELDCISVRDINSKNIVERISDKKATVVLDPTLLWDFNNDKNIVVPLINDKYVAVYGSFFTNDQICWIKDYCKENSFKILYLDSVGDTCNWCDIFIKAQDITPFEWAGYIKSCELLMTCTYHGLMFGLIFNKKIVFNPTQFMLDKASSFIKEIGMEEKLLSNKDIDSKVLTEWNYPSINEKITRLKEESLKYLTESMGDEDE